MGILIEMGEERNYARWVEATSNRLLGSFGIPSSPKVGVQLNPAIAPQITVKMLFGTKFIILYWRDHVKSGCAIAGFHCMCISVVSTSHENGRRVTVGTG